MNTPDSIWPAFAEWWRMAHKLGLIWPQPRTLLSAEERGQALREAGLNVFRLPSEAVFIDLLTDSGTGRMSMEQWLAMLKGDESYAGSASWQRFRVKIQEVFGFPHVLPVHQGRAAERIFFETVLKDRKKYVAGNAPFDTTRHWIEHYGGAVADFTSRQAWSDTPQPFKGNADTKRLERFLSRHSHETSCLLITITCNSIGGQPVAIDNIRAVRDLARRHGKIPLFLDAARFAENAYFNLRAEPKMESIAEVVKITMALADGILVSAKKDCLANIGGFIALRDQALYERLAPMVTAQEGLASGYGGMAGYTMESITAGIDESLNEEYLRERIELNEYLADELKASNVPTLQAGGHGVFIDAGAFLNHIPWHQFPGQALALALYLEGGIRSVEIGSLMLGRAPQTKKNRRARRELTRLAFPRRVYDFKECAFIAETMRAIAARKNKIRGVRFAPGGEARILRHFDSTFEWVG